MRLRTGQQHSRNITPSVPPSPPLRPRALTLKVKYIALGRVRVITVPPSLTRRGIRSACRAANKECEHFMGFVQMKRGHPAEAIARAPHTTTVTPPETHPSHTCCTKTTNTVWLCVGEIRVTLPNRQTRQETAAASVFAYPKEGVGPDRKQPQIREVRNLADPMLRMRGWFNECRERGWGWHKVL